MWAHNFIMLINMTAFWDMSVHVLNHNGVRWANFKAVNLCALSQEESNGFFIADLKTWLHHEALTVPECIQVRLAEPLASTFNMILMMCCELNALIMLYMHGQLFEVYHCVAEQSVLVACLLSLVINQLMREALLYLLTSAPLILLMELGCLIFNVLVKLIESKSLKWINFMNVMGIGFSMMWLTML